MSLSLVLAYLEHQVDGLLIPRGELQLPLVADEPPVVSQLPDRLQHRRGELVVVVEARLDQLRRLLQGDRPPTVRHHLVKELKPLTPWEVLQREGLISQVVQIILG